MWSHLKKIAQERLTLCVDADDTLLEYDGYKPGVFGKPKSEVVDKLKEIKDKGVELILSTARGEDELEGLVNHLHEQNIGELFDDVRAGEKPKAFAYLDDKAVNVMEEGWEDKLDEMLEKVSCTMWTQLKKIAEKLQGVKVKPVNAYENVMAYFRYRYKDQPELLNKIEKLSSMPVVSLSASVWEDYGMTGTGILIHQEDIEQTLIQLNRNGFKRDQVESGNIDEDVEFRLAGYPGFDRDFNIYKIYRDCVKTTPFILTDESAAEASVIHEFSHIIGSELGHESKRSVDMREYFSDESEQFSYQNEMRYYKLQGRSFAQYIHDTHPNLYSYWKQIKEQGKESVEPKVYEDVVADLNDYKKIWDSV